MLQTIYHELAPNDGRNIERLRELGLYSWSESLKKKGLRDVNEAISYEEWFDSNAEKFLPPHLKNKGFFRLSSVFAWPHIPQNGRRIVELVIDGKEGLVVSYDCYTSAANFGKRENPFVERYWSEAALLEDFLARYAFRPYAGNQDHYVWQDENGFGLDKQEVIFKPEAIREFRKILPLS